MAQKIDYRYIVAPAGVTPTDGAWSEPQWIETENIVGTPQRIAREVQRSSWKPVGTVNVGRTIAGSLNGELHPVAIKPWIESVMGTAFSANVISGFGGTEQYFALEFGYTDYDPDDFVLVETVVVNGLTLRLDSQGIFKTQVDLLALTETVSATNASAVGGGSSSAETDETPCTSSSATAISIDGVTDFVVETAEIVINANREEVRGLGTDGAKSHRKQPNSAQINLTIEGVKESIDLVSKSIANTKIQFSFTINNGTNGLVFASTGTGAFVSGTRPLKRSRTETARQELILDLADDMSITAS